jgi:disulfide bond formation protein DsbB
MLNSRTFNFILILVGGIIALYANAEEQQEVYILLIGIIILMFGLYRLSRGISHRKINSEDSTNLDEEE